MARQCKEIEYIYKYTDKATLWVIGSLGEVYKKWKKMKKKWTVEHFEILKFWKNVKNMKSKMKFWRRFKPRTATLYPSAHSSRRELCAGVLNVTGRARKVVFTMKLLSLFLHFLHLLDKNEMEYIMKYRIKYIMKYKIKYKLWMIWE